MVPREGLSSGYAYDPIMVPGRPVCQYDGIPSCHRHCPCGEDNRHRQVRTHTVWDEVADERLHRFIAEHS